MNLDRPCSTSSCARPAGALAVDEAAEELVCIGVRARLPGPRRHPGAARRRGPQARLTKAEARLADDLRRRPASTTRPRSRGPTHACATWPRAAPGYAARRSPGGRRRRGGAATLRRPAPGGGRRRARLPAAARGARAVVPGAVRGLARARPARLGREPRPGRGARPRGQRRRHRRRRSPRRSGAAASWSSPARRAPWSPSTPRAATARCCPPQSGDQLAIAVVMLDLLDRVHLGPADRSRASSPTRSTRSPSPAPRTGPRGQPGQDPGHRLADSNPLVWGGSVLAARAARRIAESHPPRHRPHRPGRRRRAPAARPRGGRAGRPVRRPLRRRQRRSVGPPWCCSTTARPATRPSREQRGRLEEAARDARRPRRDHLHGGRRRRRPLRRLLSTGTYAAAYLQLGLAPELPGSPAPPVPSRHVNRRWHQGGRRGAARQPRHRDHEVPRVLRSPSRRSMLAEAIHSVADSGNQVLLLLGGRQGRARTPRPSTPSATAGSATSTLHRRDRAVQRRRPVRALRGVPQVPRGARRTRTTSVSSTAAGGGCRCVVLGVAIVMEAFSFRTAIRETNKVRGDAHLGPVHPAGQGTGAAGDPAGGLRRAARPGVRADRRRR